MDSSRDDTTVGAALAELRPAPRPEFAAELDERVAAGFPRRSRLGALVERMRAMPPRRVLLPVGAAAILAVVVAGALSTIDRSGGGTSSDIAALPSEPSSRHAGKGEATQEASGASAEPYSEVESASNSRLSLDGATSSSGAATGVAKRSVERSTRLAVGVEPGGVGDASSQVFDIVHAYDGIVLRSSLQEGSERDEAARFELLIPSGKLGDALAEFSGLGEVLTRRERTADITAPTVGTAERLQDSRARIDSLLSQLSGAETEAERETVEAELRAERRRAARLRARLATLKRRANLSRLSLRIESSAATGSGGSWTVGDAFDDAGRVLSVIAAVAIVVLAVLAPIALLALLAWLAHRAWLHRARTRALS